MLTTFTGRTKTAFPSSGTLGSPHISPSPFPSLPTPPPPQRLRFKQPYYKHKYNDTRSLRHRRREMPDEDKVLSRKITQDSGADNHHPTRNQCRHQFHGTSSLNHAQVHARDQALMLQRHCLCSKQDEEEKITQTINGQTMEYLEALPPTTRGARWQCF